MAIAISLVLLVLLLIFMWDQNNTDNLLLDDIRELRQLVVKQEEDRMYAKCSGLFARLLRALGKENVHVSYSREGFDRMKLALGDTTINVAVRPNSGAFETGQLIAYADGYPTIHSCEEDIRIFARQIHQALVEIGVRRSS